MCLILFARHGFEVTLGHISQMYREFARYRFQRRGLLTWRTGALDRIRAVGFDRVPSASLLVYYKRDLGGPRRALYRVQDLADALVEDSCARIPGLRRLVRPYVAPPVGD